MDKNFSKFKKRVWLHILIKCLSIGLSAAAFAVNAVLIPCRLCGVNIFWLYYVLIGLGGFLIGGGAAFLCLKTNDKEIAKLLDKELDLQERVQTAYEFRGQTGDIFDLQAVNASVALGGVTKALPFKNLVATVLCGVVGVTCSAVVPPVIAQYVPPVFATTQPEEPPEDYDPPREVTDWEWAALDELINYVKTSQKADGVTKSGMVQKLEGLRNVLINGVSESSLKTFVENTATEIRNVVKDANDREDISEEQKALNSEEEEAVIKRLYQIFAIDLPGGDDNGDKNGESKEPSEGEPSQDPAAPGGMDLNDTPFYDPQKGYITVGEAMKDGDYYEKFQAALDEGTISREEWEEILILYYQSLSSNNKN